LAREGGALPNTLAREGAWEGVARCRSAEQEMREGVRKRQRKKKGRKKWIGGKKVISRGFDDLETAWQAYV